MMEFFQKLGARFDQHSQSILLAFLFFVSGVGLILGGINLRSSLSSPFIEQPNSVAQIADATAQTTDTDSDGLLDEAELTQYGTSPYLADSDSDGVSDADEIAAGTDPNCPTGKNCQAVAELDVPSAAGDAFASLLQASAGVTTEPTPAQVRAALIVAGVPEAELAKLSDDDVLAAYRSVAASQPTTQPATGGITGLSPDALRKLLKEQGVTDAQLAKISDAQLLALYEQTLKQTQQ